MARIDCERLEQIRRRQRTFWLSCLAVVLSGAAAVAALSGLVPRYPHLPIFAILIIGSYFMIVSTVQLFQTRCPRCFWFIGARPLPPCKFMVCKSCGRRIECEKNSRPAS